MTRRVAFVFPGQGSQRPSMAMRWHGDAAATVFAPIGAGAGMDIAKLADDAELCGRSTAVGQPAILAASLAADHALRAAGVVPHVVAGHSLGELSACASVGALTLEQAGAIVAERGRAMADACRSTPGAMAAVVKFATDDVAHILTDFDGVTIANENAVGQLVISGAQPDFDRAVAALREAGARLIPLRVEGAFHSPAMAPAVVRLDAALRRIELAEPTGPLVTGSTGQVLRTAPELRRHLVDGILSPVRWVAVQDRLLAMGVDLVIEVGPGGVLAALLRRAHPGIEVATVAGPDDLDAVVERALAPRTPVATVA